MAGTDPFLRSLHAFQRDFASMVSSSVLSAQKTVRWTEPDAEPGEIPTTPQPRSLISPGIGPTVSLLQYLRCTTTPVSNLNGRPQRHPEEMSSVTSTSTSQTSFPTNQTHPPDSASVSSPVSPLCLHPTAVGLPFTLGTEIVMTLCGETMTYDLAGLEDDPQVIVHLLKATLSERGNWMTVGAYYRRKGKPAAALSVMTSMMEGESALGLSFL